MSSRVAALLALLYTAVFVSGEGCNYGTEIGGCCVCRAGYADSSDGPCTGCAPGYDPLWKVIDGRNELLCGSARNGTRCVEREIAPWGCGLGGRCTKGAYGTVFPCTSCEAGYSLESNCQLEEVRPFSCTPTGPRMFAPFPYEPVVGKPFSLVITGCNLRSDDRYIMIPAYKPDGETENPCEDVKDGDIAPECTLDSQSTECINGYTVTTLHRPNPGQGALGEMSINNITITREMLRGGDSGRYRRLCIATFNPSVGSRTVWRAVDAHNHHVNRRSDKFLLADEFVQLRGAGKEGGASEEGCCDGLKVGSLCLPLWAFLLLWLLMAALLGVLGYALHKNKQEIEAEKNNRKYEKFATDAEMANLAAKRDTDDDDI